MDLDKFIDDFQRILYQAILDDIAIVRRYLTNEKVFAYSLWLADGPRALGGSACTQKNYLDTIKRLKEHAEDSQYNKEHLEEDIALAEVCVYEWDYSSPFGENDKPFSELWSFLDKSIDAYYNDVYRINKKIASNYNNIILSEIVATDEKEMPFFNIIYSLMLKVLLKIKEEKHLKGAPFIDDILYGIQYGESIYDCQIDLMLLFSERLNSPYWHKKMIASYLPLKERD